MNYLVIYPNKEQTNRILEKYRSESIRIIHEDDDSFIENIESFKILCCSESAIYYLNRYSDKHLDIGFDKSCLEFYQKSNMKDSFIINGINCPEYRFDNNYYPSIAKPNFGFASIGVKRINNSDEQLEYEKTISDLICKTELLSVNNKYFRKLHNKIIYEDAVENSIFYSVPFIRLENEIIVFPIRGKSTYKTDFTDFYWSEFIFDNENMNTEIAQKIKELLHKVSSNYISRNSINTAEVLYDRKSKEVFLIEFSPRVPGGRLAKMIELSTGININSMAIDLFFEKQIENVSTIGKSIRLRLEFNDEDEKHESFNLEECIYSRIFNRYIKYRFYRNNKKIGLIPGRFAPIHKGHQFMIEYAYNIVDQIVILIFDTKDTVVPLETRAQWLQHLYPNATIIKGYNCPDGEKYAYENGPECEYIQNEYIKEITNNIEITHVIHSTLYGDSVSAFLGAQSVMIDLERTKYSISGTMIRQNPQKYKDYLCEYIYTNYCKYINVSENEDMPLLSD